jgi:hypothetical protein
LANDLVITVAIVKLPLSVNSKMDADCAATIKLKKHLLSDGVCPNERLPRHQASRAGEPALRRGDCDGLARKIPFESVSDSVNCVALWHRL